MQIEIPYRPKFFGLELVGVPTLLKWALQTLLCRFRLIKLTGTSVLGGVPLGSILGSLPCRTGPTTRPSCRTQGS